MFIQGTRGHVTMYRDIHWKERPCASATPRMPFAFMVDSAYHKRDMMGQGRGNSGVRELPAVGDAFHRPGAARL